MKAALYFHTVRYLRFAQIAERLRARLWQPRPDLAPPPVRRRAVGPWVTPCARAPSMLAADRVVFLNEAGTVAARSAWNDPAKEKLWLYNLHYFDDLTARDAAERHAWHERLIVRWIAENPPAVGNGWEPYPTSLRIVNWIKWALGGAALDQDAIASLAVQARLLCARPEYHLLGNHLLANAKALIFAGAFFAGQEAEKWLATGRAILRRELAEQILADGGHFERSPMYHSIILEDLLDIVNIGNAYGLEPVVAPETIECMRTWLATMCHPDGAIAFFNDAAFGIASGRHELDEYAGRLQFSALRELPDGVHQLSASGFVRVQTRESVLLADVGSVGPDYLPGHAHAGTLSFELSVRGQRILVNSGTSCYGAGSERQRQRGTAAHNCVVVDDQDSSEVWGGFRVARRARVGSLDVAATANGGRIEATHDGYRRLPGHNLHRRNWLVGLDELVIVDEVTGSFGHAEARFHLHPEVDMAKLDANAGRAWLSIPGGGELEMAVEGGVLAAESGTWHPGFGIAVPNACLVAKLAGSRMKTTIRRGVSA